MLRYSGAHGISKIPRRLPSARTLLASRLGQHCLYSSLSKLCPSLVQEKSLNVTGNVRFDFEIAASLARAMFIRVCCPDGSANVLPTQLIHQVIFLCFDIFFVGFSPRINEMRTHVGSFKYEWCSAFVSNLIEKSSQRTHQNEWPFNISLFSCHSLSDDEERLSLIHI